MRVMVLGAGGPAAIGFCRALRMSQGDYHLIGVDMNETNLDLAEVDETYRGGARVIVDLINKSKPDFVHAQPDPEVARLSIFRHTLATMNVAYYLPAHRSIRLCQDKWDSYRIWEDARLPVPKTFLVRKPTDVLRPELPDNVFVRRRTGAGGADSLAGSRLFAAQWIEQHNGFGEFTVAEHLPGPTVTWQSLWFKGELVVGQGRSRLAWTHGDRGSALVSESVTDEEVDTVSEAAIRAIDPTPHGLWGVDMTRDSEGQPRLTEINIGRFFTTAPEFFAKAGFNIADLYVQTGFHGTPMWTQSGKSLAPNLNGSTRNPIPAGLKWIRSMDREAVLR